MPKVKINISLSFIIYLILIAFLGSGLSMITYLIVLFLHEYSHAYVAYRLGYKLSNIKLAPFGICLNLTSSNIDKYDNIKIAIAGPLVNFLMAFICLGLWWVFPGMYFFTYGIFEASLVTAMFNLLPCYPLDGARVLSSLLPQKLNNRVVFIVLNVIFSAMFISLFIFTLNISILLIAIFIFTSIFTFNKAPSYDYLLYERKTKESVLPAKVYLVDSSLKLFKLMPYISAGSFSIFVVSEDGATIGNLTENDLQVIFERFVPTASLKDVLNGYKCQKLN